MPESDAVLELEGFRIFKCSPEGQPLRDSPDATELIGAARSQGVTLVVIPEERLGDDFFRLKTGIAGEILQKFIMYDLKVAIVGDISRYTDQSLALRDFVYECNEGVRIWFLPDLRSVAERLRSHLGIAGVR
ncbi:MAG TPA: DUF4180 domain-containing protein [Bryobacteraceae bacterium]|nr:DUF4180 domain-containing protein [Bryobacteraceae bacterium]